MCRLENRRRGWIIASLLAAGVMIGGDRITAQETKADNATAAVKESAAEFAKAFSAHDVDALAKMWTEQGVYVDPEGVRVEGREAITKDYETLFAQYPDIQMDVEVTSVRLLNATTAIEEGVTTAVPMPDAVPVSTQYSATHVLQDGEWLMADVRDHHSQSAGQDSILQALQWMVGHWSAEHAGVTADVACDWVADDRYLQRDFRIKKGDEAISSSVEIIGWDPLGQQIVSWTFSSSGGRSVGSWTPTEEGWLVQQNGVSATGIPTSAVGWWAPLADGALGWSGAMRSVDGQPLANPRDVVLVPVGNQDEKAGADSGQ